MNEPNMPKPIRKPVRLVVQTPRSSQQVDVHERLRHALLEAHPDHEQHGGRHEQAR